MQRRKVPLISGLELKAAEATQPHLRATPKPPQSQLIANRLRPQSHSKATLKPPQSHPKATPKLPSSHAQAAPRPPSNQLIRPFQNLGGAKTTCFPGALAIVGMAVLRPSVTVLTSLAPDRLARYGGMEAYLRANARLFCNQQALDWASVQCESLTRLRELSLPVSAKVIAFRRRPAAVAACQACVPGERGTRANSCHRESFYSLHRRGFVARSSAEAARNATSGDVVLLALACSSWDQFQNHQYRGEVFCQAVKSIGRGVRGGTPNIHGETVTAQHWSRALAMKNLLRGFLRENPRAKRTNSTNTSIDRRNSAI